jgi:poly(A) polymerase
VMVLSFNQFASLNESTYGTLEDAKTVILVLRKHGFVGYLAGGCVRDFIAGHPPKDFDVATDATPEEVLKIFPGTSVVGKSFGVVVCHGIDIATFRKDGKYTDGRHPDEVILSRDPKDDSNRRDFTMNAMFMDPFTGDILDFHGGQADAKNGLIKCVGNPNDRFTQDYLRMLRAHRFQAKLGFDIHPDTLTAMQAHAPNIAKMDVERIQNELIKGMGHDPYKMMVSMKTTGILKYVLPEVDSLSPSQFSTMTTTLHDIGTGMNPELGMAGALMDFPSATAAKITRRLKFTNDEIKHITSVLDMQDRISKATPHTTMDVLKRLMRETFFKDALMLYKGRVAAHDPNVHPQSLEHLTALYGALTHEDLSPSKFVTGDDLIALGMKPGPEFKRMLDAAENGQLTGHIKTKEQALDLIRNGRL